MHRIKKIDILDRLATDVDKTNDAWVQGIPLLPDPYKDLELKKAREAADKQRARKGGFFSGLFGGSNQEEDLMSLNLRKQQTELQIDKLEINNECLSSIPDTKGIYLYGGPGSGKTFMMDLFYSQMQIQNRKRASYTSFVLQIHKMNHLNYQKKVYDPLFQTSLDVAKQYRLFCFDEMQVTEVGDAMLMKRFFDIMWKLKVVLVVACV